MGAIGRAVISRWGREKACQADNERIHPVPGRVDPFVICSGWWIGDSGVALVQSITFVLVVTQAAWVQVLQVQSAQVQFAQESLQLAHSQALWLQVGQVQSVQSQAEQESLQLAQVQTSHSS